MSTTSRPPPSTRATACKVIEAAYESHEELGEVSLMITKHCVRYSLQPVPQAGQGRDRRAGHAGARRALV
jgi:hypothetical protein